MGIKSVNLNFDFSVRNYYDLVERISDEDFIQLILKEIIPDRRKIAERQIRIYFQKITSHFDMRSHYIKKIKELIEFENQKVS